MVRNTKTVRLATPQAVLLQEAVALAGLFSRHWQTVAEGSRVVRPGLELAAPRLSPKTGEEILGLVAAIRDAHVEAAARPKPRADGAVLERARFVIEELDAIIAWHLAERAGPQLAEVRKEARRGASVDATASALAHYAELASHHLAELAAVPGFDRALVGEARQLATALRERDHRADVKRSGHHAATVRRRELLGQLVEKMGLVRAAARFVYRRDPDVVRLFTSEYARKKKRENRAAKGKASET